MPLSSDDEQRIVRAIESAEQRCSGELRVHIQAKCTGEPLKDAQRVFTKLGMHQTELRNGILFYFALDSRKYAVLGDTGIHAKVGQAFWDGIRDAMAVHLRAGHLIEAIELGIAQAGSALATYFPHQGAQDRDELSNEVSRG